MRNIIYIFIGGGIGSVFRFLVSKNVSPVIFSSVPFGTLFVNVLGSFLIGCFYIVSEKCSFSVETRLFLTTGLCGGFTTFSTFSYETMMLLRHGDYSAFALSVFLHLFCCIVGVFLGIYLLQRML